MPHYADPGLAPPHGQSAAAEQPWWRGAAIYQIYPRSFRDTNGDGIGDLAGVVQGLDYVAALGVDAVWLSPFFTSPMRDFGYDVADYCGVDPIFGTLTDFDRVIDKAHSLGLKVIIDQVYSHTSDQHAWFAESRLSRTNPKADWYVWAEPKADGGPPTNWLSNFGGSAWTYDSRRKQYYLHNFLSCQPDLNGHHPDVQNALLDVARFWLDRGVDGFRLDAINFTMHDLQLRDNPPAPPGTPMHRHPYDMQMHIRNQSHKDIPNFLEKLRTVLDGYGAVFTVAEVGGRDPLPEMKAFTEGGRLSSAYSFEFLYASTVSAPLIKKALRAWLTKGTQGWPSWAFSNHDAPRVVTRWAAGRPPLEAAKLFGLLLCSLYGNVFIYQGEELGLPQADIPFEALQDPEAIANWPVTLGRDGARTPLPWSMNAPFWGFSDQAAWLLSAPEHGPLTIDRQETDRQSTLHFFRQALGVRAASPALRFGSCEVLDSPDDILALRRVYDNEEALAVFNLGTEPLSWQPSGPAGFTVDLAAGVSGAVPPTDLPPSSGYIARRHAG